MSDEYVESTMRVVTRRRRDTARRHSADGGRPRHSHNARRRLRGAAQRTARSHRVGVPRRLAGAALWRRPAERAGRARDDGRTARGGGGAGVRQRRVRFVDNFYKDRVVKIITSTVVWTRLGLRGILWFLSMNEWMEINWLLYYHESIHLYRLLVIMAISCVILFIVYYPFSHKVLPGSRQASGWASVYLPTWCRQCGWASVCLLTRCRQRLGGQAAERSAWTVAAGVGGRRAATGS